MLNAKNKSFKTCLTVARNLFQEQYNIKINQVALCCGLTGTVCT